jgi:hypothetical protein
VLHERNNNPFAISGGSSLTSDFYLHDVAHRFMFVWRRSGGSSPRTRTYGFSLATPQPSSNWTSDLLPPRLHSNLARVDPCWNTANTAKLNVDVRKGQGQIVSHGRSRPAWGRQIGSLLCWRVAFASGRRNVASVSDILETTDR